MNRSTKGRFDSRIGKTWPVCSPECHKSDKSLPETRQHCDQKPVNMLS